MEIFAKFYHSQFGTVPYAQTGTVLELKIEEDVTASGSCTLSFPEYIENLVQFDFCEVVSVSNVDTVIFRGFIENIKPTFGKITLELSAEKAFLKYKRVATGTTFTAQPIATCINSMLSAWNAYTGDTLSLVTASTFNIISKSVAPGDSFYDIINEFCTSANLLWDCSNGVITIADFLGVDYTGASNFRELIYDGDSLGASNVAKLTPELTSSSANVIFGTDGTLFSVQKDAAQLAIYSPVSDSVQLRKTNQTGLDADTLAELTKRKTMQWQYAIVPAQDFVCEAGDKVSLSITNYSPYVDFDGTVVVTQKTVELKNGSLIASYTVSDKFVTKETFFTRLRDVEANLRLRILQ